MEYGISGYRSSQNHYRTKTVVQLDKHQSDLSGDGVAETIYLLGIKNNDDLIINEITLVIENGKDKERRYYAIPTSSGMGGGIHVEDFNHDGQLDIGVYILSGGTGNELKYFLLLNHNHEFCLAFSSDMYEEKMKYQVQYLDRYQVEVKNLNSEQTRLINLKDKSPEYLKVIYDEQGMLKEPIQGIVAHVSDADSIESKMFDQGSDLILTHRILGRSHNDTLGYVSAYLVFDNEKYHVYKILVSQ